MGKTAGIYSKALGYLAAANAAGQPLTADPIQRRKAINYPILELIGMALSDLVGNSIYVYLADRSTLYGTYPSYSQTMMALNPVKCNRMSAKQAEVQSRGLQRSANCPKLAETEKGSFYIARNPIFVTRKTYFLICIISSIITNSLHNEWRRPAPGGGGPLSHPPHPKDGGGRDGSLWGYYLTAPVARAKG